MADIFQPQVAQINSAVTPEQGVADTTAVDLFVDVAKVATEATFSYTGQRELSDLSGKFDKITQAREAGANSSTLQVKARAELDAAKANSPWVADQADKLFRDTFGGSSATGGIFKATPQEEAREKHLQRVEETRLALGLSTSEEAQKRISLDENAKSAKIQADAQKNVRQYNGELVFSNTQAQLNNNSIKFMDAINRTMTQNGGTLSNHSTRSLDSAIDRQALQLKQELNSQTRDPNTGHLLIDKAGLVSNLKEIEDWVADTKAMVGDQSYLKVIQDLNTEQNAEINFIATKKYKTLKELKAAGGDVAVKAYLDAAKRPEGTDKQLLIKANVFAEDMFKQQGSFNQAASTGYDKIILPTPSSNIMSEPEALATGTQLNDPANAKLMESTVEQVGSVPDAVKPYETMIQKNPDSSALTYSQRFKAWSNANKDKANTVIKTTEDGLVKSFKSAFISDTGTANIDFNFVTVPAGSSFGVDRLAIQGEGLTSDNSGALMNLYRMYTNNTQALQLVRDKAGEDLTPEQAVKFTVLGSSTDTSANFSPETTTEKLSKLSLSSDDMDAYSKAQAAGNQEIVEWAKALFGEVGSEVKP